MDKKIDKGCPKKMEIKFYSRVIIFSPFYQVLGFKIRLGAGFFWDTLYIDTLTVRKEKYKKLLPKLYSYTRIKNIWD